MSQGRGRFGRIKRYEEGGWGAGGHPGQRGQHRPRHEQSMWHGSSLRLEGSWCRQTPEALSDHGPIPGLSSRKRLHCPTCGPRVWACTSEGPAPPSSVGQAVCKPERTCPTGAHISPGHLLGTQAPGIIWASTPPFRAPEACLLVCPPIVALNMTANSLTLNMGLNNSLLTNRAL